MLTLGFGFLSNKEVLIGLTAAGVVLILRQLSLRKSRRPPGPSVWPVVGSLPSLRNDFLIFKELAEKYGDIFYCELGLFGHQPTVVLSSIKLIREALLHKRDDFAGRYRTHTIDIISENGCDIPFGDFTPTWRFQRKIAIAALRKFTSGDRFQVLIEHSVQVVSEIFQNANGRLIDIHSPVSLIFYNILAAMCFGKKYNLNDPEFNNILNLVDELNSSFTGFTLADMLPALKHIPTKMQKLVRKNSKALENFIDGAIYDHRDKYDKSEQRDLTDFFIHLDYETVNRFIQTDQMKLEHVHIQQILLDMFSAGTDTSRLTLTWALLYLAACPAVQEKAQLEIDKQFGKDGVISITNRVNIPYCQAIIYETLRLRHPAPLALPHKTTCDTSVGGYDIPEGTQILVNLVKMHMDPNEWNNPEEFRPERFIDEHGNLAPKPNSFLPFSTGRRQCIGEALAKAALHVILGTLLQKFTFHPPRGKKVDLTFKKSILAYFANCTELVVKVR